jgi:hypothetical protein
LKFRLIGHFARADEEPVPFPFRPDRPKTFRRVLLGGKPMKFSVFFAALALTFGVAYADASADQAKVEAALKADGFTRWKSIILDNKTWEVDDAINGAGKQFDLRVDADTLKITSQIAE